MMQRGRLVCGGVEQQRLHDTGQSMSEQPAETRNRASVVAGLDACAVSIPMTLGGSVILYGQIAPEWLGPGVLAGCLGYALVHALGAHMHRPVVSAARFF